MSAAPQNDDKPNEDHYEGTEINGGVSIYDQFANELDQRADSIASMLPSTVTFARFKNTVVAAIRQDPAILQATIRSIMGAVIRAAQDGLVPDGREGHIAVYSTNVAKRGERDRWEKRAQWNPMAAGLRKRLRELDRIIANAEVVHEKDKFIWRQGDDPHIEHEPARLGIDRGKMIGAYCIYKREDGTILHREVMDCIQIEKTREQSKAKDSLMWTKFVSEGYRKSVLRRGIKTVPVTDQMREIIQRDDEASFDFAHHGEPTAVLTPPPAPPPAPKAIEQKAAVTLPNAPPKAPEPMPAGTKPRRKAGEPRREEPEAPRSSASIAAEEIGGPLDEASERALDRQAARGEEPPPDQLRDWLEDHVRDAQGDKDMKALDRRDDEVCKELDGADREDLRARWNEVYQDRKAELKPKK